MHESRVAKLLCVNFCVIQIQFELNSSYESLCRNLPATSNSWKDFLRILKKPYRKQAHVHIQTVWAKRFKCTDVYYHKGTSEHPSQRHFRSSVTKALKSTSWQQRSRAVKSEKHEAPWNRNWSWDLTMTVLDSEEHKKYKRLKRRSPGPEIRGQRHWRLRITNASYFGPSMLSRSDDQCYVVRTINAP